MHSEANVNKLKQAVNAQTKASGNYSVSPYTRKTHCINILYIQFMTRPDSIHYKNTTINIFLRPERVAHALCGKCKQHFCNTICLINLQSRTTQCLLYLLTICYMASIYLLTLKGLALNIERLLVFQNLCQVSSLEAFFFLFIFPSRKRMEHFKVSRYSGRLHSVYCK